MALCLLEHQKPNSSRDVARKYVNCLDKWEFEAN